MVLLSLVSAIAAVSVAVELVFVSHLFDSVSFHHLVPLFDVISLQMRREIHRTSIQPVLHQRPAQSTRCRRVPRYEALPHATLLTLDTPRLDARVLLKQLITHVAVVLAFSGIKALTTVCLSCRCLMITCHLYSHTTNDTMTQTVSAYT